MRILKGLVLFVGWLITIGTIAHAETIKIGHMPVANQADIIADEKGFFKKNGLDVELKLFQTGPSALQGLLSGDLQAVEAGGNSMINLASQGVSVYFLVSGGMNTPQHPAGSIFVRSGETTIKSFSDLKGKKLGTLPKGTITNLWISNAVAKAGIERSALTEVPVPFPQMGGLLASGQVDAIYTWPPFDTMTEQAGQGKRLVNDTEWNPYAVLNALIVRRDWADKNPDDVRKLVKSMIEAHSWIDDNVDEERAILGRRLKLSESVYKNMRMFYFPRNGYQVMPSIWDYYYLMLKAKELQPIADPKAIFEKYWYEPAKKFIDPVIAEIGRQPDPVVDSLYKIKLQNLSGPISDYLGPWER